MLKIISFFLISIYFTVSALSLNGDINLEKATNSSLKISWSKVTDALCYTIYYDTQSRAEDDRSYSEEILCIDDDNYVSIEDGKYVYKIDNLKANTDYYIALSVVSSDGSAGDLSKEFTFKTKKSSSGAVSLKLDMLEVLYKEQIKLTFNIDLDTTAPREFKIVDRNDSTIELGVESSEVTSPREVIINLSDNLTPGGEYTLTVMSLSGANGENIELGVDGISTFIAPIDLISKKEIDEIANDPAIVGGTSDSLEDNLDAISNPDELVNPDEFIELNAAAPNGADVSDEVLNNNVDMASKNAKDLPKTGPEYILLFLLALLLTIFIFVFKKKNS